MIQDDTPAMRFFAGTLTQEALNRVIAAPRLPCIIPLQQAHALIGAIAGLAFRVVVEPAPAAKEATDRVRSTWIAFVQAASRLNRTTDALPTPELLAPIGEWVSDFPKRGPGAPASQRDAVVYSMLSSSYHHLFRQAPAATLNGPTSRFIAAFNLMMVEALKKVDRKENGVSVPQARWIEPTAANLSKKIEKHGRNAEADALFQDILRTLARRQT